MSDPQDDHILELAVASNADTIEDARLILLLSLLKPENSKDGFAGNRSLRKHYLEDASMPFRCS